MQLIFVLFSWGHVQTLTIVIHICSALSFKELKQISCIVCVCYMCGRFSEKITNFRPVWSTAKCFATYCKGALLAPYHANCFRPSRSAIFYAQQTSNSHFSYNLSIYILSCCMFILCQTINQSFNSKTMYLCHLCSKVSFNELNGFYKTL